MSEWFKFNKDYSSKEVYDKLSKEEKTILNSFKDKIMINASEERAKGGIREILRFKVIVNKPLNKIDNKDLGKFITILNSCDFAEYTKEKIKAHIHSFLKWNFKDWSIRFDNFEDIKYNSDAERKKKITSEAVLTKENIETIMKTEPNLYWKTFFIVMYEGAFRPGELRKLKWSTVKIDKGDDFAYVEVSSKKNSKRREKKRELPLKASLYYLQELKKQQRTQKINSEWVFPSPFNPSKHISKAVNLWFNKLTKKALGRQINPYLLRHTRGTELKQLVLDGKMSKDNAVKFMGHSEEMFDKVYSHVSDDLVKELMKKQIYNFEYLPKEKKHELEIEINAQKKEMEGMKKMILLQRTSYIADSNKLIPLIRKRILEDLNSGSLSFNKEQQKFLFNDIPTTKELLNTPNKPLSATINP